MADKTSERKSGNIARLAKSTLQSFSAHGIPKIVSHELGLVKAMWLVFFLGSAGLCAWFIQMTVSNYRGIHRNGEPKSRLLLVHKRFQYIHQ